MIRIGEIILIDTDSVTLECYSSQEIVIGSILCTETVTHYGLLSSLTSVCIEEGKASQAFGDAQSNDASNSNNFPHLKNSLRILGKAQFWEKEANFMTLNQGIYLAPFNSALLSDKLYWHTVQKITPETLQKHIFWLQKNDPLFNLDEYLHKLSKYSRPLAWNAYLEHIED